MKLVRIIAAISVLFAAPSCAFLFNEKTVEVRIESNPAGADLMIDGVQYGRTPITLRLEPKNYVAVLNKEGYGTAQIQLEAWQAVRADKVEGKRCMADTLGSIFILPLFSVWSVYCRDFKQPRYNINIPYMGPAGSGVSGSSTNRGAPLPYDNSYSRDNSYGQQPYYDNGYSKRY